MKDAEILDRVDKLRVWQQHGERAPHKPLLLLFALGRFSHDEITIPFVTVEEKLRLLLEEFGPRVRCVTSSARCSAHAVSFGHAARDPTCRREVPQAGDRRLWAARCRDGAPLAA